MKLWALILAASIALCGCGSQVPASDSNTPSEGGDTDVQAAYEKALSGKDIKTTFIGEPLYDGTIENEDDAQKAVESIADRIGADDTTILELDSIRPTETGVTYYTFRQVAGDVSVYGASVKLVVDGNHKAIGAVSAILPNVEAPSMDTWAVSKEDAEKVVRKYLDGEGLKNVEIETKATEQALIPLSSGSSAFRYAWAVFTPNYYDNSHMPYVAHYVSEDGEYLYNLPISAPDSLEALSGEDASVSFDFDSYTCEKRSYEVTHANGSKENIEVPVLVDSKTKEVLLGDSERKILCADYAEKNFNNNLVPTTAENDKFDNIQLLEYYTFIRVWDFFDQRIGWHGPDGDDTPALLLMNYVDENGEPEENAFYIAKIDGFQTFSFTNLVSFGDCMDVIAHEFTHCITSTAMLTNIYMNDYGAINEGMSDVIGNLVEMIVTKDPDLAWKIGEGIGDDHISRSMSDPHVHNQPEYVWDTYYTPSVLEGTDLNDNGGVHTNSSLLNTASYKLDQAGMKPEDQAYYWMNVALALTPQTDYPQMAELLPWLLKVVGQEKYVDTLNNVIKDAKYTETKTPTTPPEGSGIVQYEHTNKDESRNGSVMLTLVSNTDETFITTWPKDDTSIATAVVPAGDYTATVTVKTEDGLKDSEPKVIHVESGKTCKV